MGGGGKNNKNEKINKIVNKNKRKEEGRQIRVTKGQKDSKREKE